MEGARIEYRIGPVPQASARAWLRVTRRNLEQVVAAGPRAPFRIPTEVAVQLREVIDGWEAAATSDPYEFDGSEDVLVARRLLTYWLNIVSLSAAQRRALGVEDWPAEAAAFEGAVGRAILASLGADERLRRIWHARVRTTPS
jgi:hypothetical protein